MRDPIDALRSLKKYLSLALPAAENWEVRYAHEEGTFTRPFCRVGIAGQSVHSGSAYLMETVQAYSILCHPKEAVNTEAAVLEGERVRGLLTDAIWRGAGPIPPPSGLTVAPALGSLPAGTYAYRVTSVTRHGESVTAPPAYAVLDGGGGVALTWTPAAGVGRYRVYRGGAGVERVLAEVTTPAFIDDGTRKLGGAPKPHGTLGMPKRIPLWDWDGVDWFETTAARGEADFMTVRDFGPNVVRDPTDDLLLAVTADVRLAWRSTAYVPPKGGPLKGTKVRFT